MLRELPTAAAVQNWGMPNIFSLSAVQALDRQADKGGPLLITNSCTWDIPQLLQLSVPHASGVFHYSGSYQLVFLLFMFVPRVDALGTILKGG